MLAKLGLFALVVLVGAESSVLLAAVLWPLVTLAHFGPGAQAVALAAALIGGGAAGLWIGWRSLQVARLGEESPPAG